MLLVKNGGIHFKSKAIKIRIISNRKLSKYGSSQIESYQNTDHFKLKAIKIRITYCARGVCSG